MLKLFDWQCQVCGTRQEYMLEVPGGATAPPKLWLHCIQCENLRLHRRELPMFAKYTGEHAKFDFNPQVAGGSFDTMGFERLPKLPSIPGEDASDKKLNDTINTMIDQGASDADVRSQIMSDDSGPSASDHKDHYRSKEWREARAERKSVISRNREKKRRAKAIAKGETTMRDSPLPGDPKAIKQGAS